MKADMVRKKTEFQILQNRVSELERQLMEAQAAVLALTSPKEDQIDVAQEHKPPQPREVGQENLMINEERFRQALLVAPYPLMIRRDDGQVVMVNAAWTETTGYTLEDIPTIEAWTRKAYGEQGLQRQSLILNEGFSQTSVKKWGEFAVTTHSGEKRIWDFSTAPLGFDENGHELVMTMAVDVTERKQAEERLRAARDEAVWLARFPGENPNPVARVSNAGIVLYHNAPAASLPGWTCAINEPLPPPLLPLVQQALTQGQMVEQNVSLGERFYSISMILFAEEGYLNLYGRDITERQRAEEALQESEERFHSLADSMPQLVWTALPDGTVDYYNQRYQEYWGLKQAKGTGWEWSPVLHPDDLQPTLQAWQRSVETGEIYQIEHQVRIADGSYRWHLSRSVPMCDETGQIIRWFGTATDIHDLKLAEAQLKDYAEQLKRSNRELEQFAFMASHDLQEPLRKIETFGDLLLERATQLDERGREYTERMRRAAGRMRDMVEGLLQLSRVTTQGKPFTHVDLSQVASEVLSDLEGQIRRTGGKVNLETLPIVEGDPLQLHQLMQNLIGNALKYYQPETLPEVKIHAKTLSGKVQILVEDNGIGFEQEDAERIFQPFQRLVSWSQYEGSGMGLAICHRIIERHGGKIAALSKPGQGATFIVTLPVHHLKNVGNELRKDVNNEDPGVTPSR